MLVHGRKLNISWGAHVPAPSVRASHGRSSSVSVRATPDAPVATKSTAAKDRNRVVLLTADDLQKTHDGERQLFSNLSFTIGTGDRVSIIGANGSGKSTLLKIVAGLDNPTGGSIVKKKSVRTGYLPQDPVLDEESTVLEAALNESSSDVARVARAYEEALLAVEAGAPGAEDRLAKAMSKMDAMNAWDLTSDAISMLEEAGLQGMLNAKVKELSGGQKRRVSIAASLLCKPQLLLMDEPTNHLDAQTINWLSKRLSSANDAAVLLVTHDRSFMEACCTRILEIDEGGGAFLHNVGGQGSYRAFLDLREDRRIGQRGEAERARTLLRTEEAWMRKQPRARQAKSKSRQDRYYELVDRANALPKDSFKVDWSGQGGEARRLGNKVLVMSEVGAAWEGRPIFSGFNYEFEPGERLAIVGPNGAGKTTLLEIIAGSNPPASGTRVAGDTCRIGYFCQVPPQVPANLKMIDYIATFVETDGPKGFELLQQKEALEVKALASSRAERQAASAAAAGAPGPSARGGWRMAGDPEKVLEKLGFPRARQNQRVGSLSGGERRRLHLATVLLSRPNVLLLDEPTNDLDLNTIEALEEFLADFPGTLITVSHDRSFLENAAERLLVLKGDGIVRYYDGSYDEYLEDLEEEDREAKAAAAAGSKGGSRSPSPPPPTASSPSPSPSPPAAAAPVASSSAKPLSDFERRELARLEAEVEKLTAEKGKLEAKLLEQSVKGDSANAKKTSEKLSKTAFNLEKSEAKWLELLERADP